MNVLLLWRWRSVWKKLLQFTSTNKYWKDHRAFYSHFYDFAIYTMLGLSEAAQNAALSCPLKYEHWDEKEKRMAGNDFRWTELMMCLRYASLSISELLFGKVIGDLDYFERSLCGTEQTRVAQSWSSGGIFKITRSPHIQANEKWILTGPSYKWLIFFLQNRLTISLSHSARLIVEVTIDCSK